ncbi:hypothetical protein CVS47_02515 [Microbacterium lemovicicum]|uniref:DUF5107 domain-containing protein n=1 Tax=Microbacterium lemovicicum TaxID=1072463 RepID=A0A3Q9J1E2_9MICO|nr:DUF5107 domain-containing protein [Microbacterium lemovicicum]AZS37868.1 hypothetical protein CVS47_02515 [Microbacterium lemovicicum]
MTVELTPDVSGAPGPAAPSRTDAHRLVLPDAPPALAETLSDGGAVAWEESLTIHTYEPDAPSRYPMYLDHRVYQGSSGKVYPLPFIEGIADEGAPREWKAVHLENAFVRLVVLPELGGRIHVGYDKTTGYDFFYRNNVIKPALVGLAGPWISGGVEFNWPQHHRPATYLPVETQIERADDGSVTVWCYDHEPFARMSAHHGVRLRPDSSVVEVVVRLHNRTKERQTFLWWANVAARVHDDYQSFFPEDVRYVADHARRALTSFPAADRPYYGVDYPALAAEREGADRIDWYRNIPVPTSYMIVDSAEDYFGGFDHAAGAGFVHWAERRISPGKKQWTWGDAPFGHAWDAQLTDDDGPYVELMAGVYTDNQPDFSWLLPGETKLFSQYWFPIPDIGVAHQATPDAAIHVDRSAEGIRIRAAVTSPQVGAMLTATVDGVVVAARRVDLRPGDVAELNADTVGDARADPSVEMTSGLRVELRDARGRLLVGWEPVEVTEGEPWVAAEPALPEAITSVEELYLTGVHLSQYRHPTRSPIPYWNEALRRDPGDVRTNLALADRDYRAGRYAPALERIDLALKRLTRRNANPMDAEAFYLRGLVLARLGRREEAEQAWGKAGWDATWAAAAGFALAQSLACTQRNRAALRVLDTLDGAVGHDARRGALRVIMLRRLGRHDEATDVLRAALADDPLDALLRVLGGSTAISDAGVLRDVALDLRDAGEGDAAAELLDTVTTAAVTPAGNHTPLAHFLAAALRDAQGRTEEAAAHRSRARAADASWAFPSGLDDLDALDAALAADPSDVVARGLRAMLLYGHGRRGDALADWNRAVTAETRDAVLLRNAALAAYNVGGDDDTAWGLYARAIAAAPGDARLLYEQDQLARRLGDSSAARLARLEPQEQLVLTRDDLTIAYVGLLVAEGRAGRGYEILTTRPFHPWEGGEGAALEAWDAARTALGMDVADPPASLGETRAQYVPPVARHDNGETDYFATSLPELLLFSREAADD